jgi:hypothetical protein
MVPWCSLKFMIAALKVATMLLVQSQMSSHCYQILLVSLILAYFVLGYQWNVFNLLFLPVIFHSTVRLDLSSNGLMGTTPSEVGFLSALSESSVVCLLAMMMMMKVKFYQCNF